MDARTKGERENTLPPYPLSVSSSLSVAPCSFRFQRKQYADIDIVKTEKKGFGVRANVDLPR